MCGRCVRCVAGVWGVCANLARLANKGAECGFSLMAAVKWSRASSRLPVEEGREGGNG